MAYEKVRIQPDGFRDERRVVIIDYNHLAYKFLFGATPLSVRVDIGNGLTKVVDTTIASHTIKYIVNATRRGLDHCIVCMDSKIISRKEGFQIESEKWSFGEPYKANRKDNRSNTSALFDGIGLTETLLRQAGVTVLREINYEADDLVMSAIQKAKREFPDMPIDVITGDWDYAPLVDEQVRVYMVSRKSTYASEQGIKHNKYVELNPLTVEEFTNETSEFKNRYVPYNSLLLWKILRGDKSDGIFPMKEISPNNGKLRNRWTPASMKELLEQMSIQGLLTPTLFGYSPNKTYVYNKVTGATYTTEQATELVRTNQVPREQLHIKIGETENHNEMVNALDKMIELGYLDGDDKEFIIGRYALMNLNGAFIHTNTKRAPYIMTEDITRIDIDRLQRVVDYLQIKIPREI